MKRISIPLLLIAVLLLAGYGGWGPAEASPTSGIQSAAPAAKNAQDAVTVNFLTDDEADILIALKAIAEAFTKSDPKYTNVNIQFQAGGVRAVIRADAHALADIEPGEELPERRRPASM